MRVRVLRRLSSRTHTPIAASCDTKCTHCGRRHRLPFWLLRCWRLCYCWLLRYWLLRLLRHWLLRHWLLRHWLLRRWLCKAKDEEDKDTKHE